MKLILPDAKQITVPYKFQCRPYQDSAWNSLRKGIKRAVLCWHRGCGKDVFAINWFVRQALSKSAVYLHCFPNYSQGKRAIWKSTHSTHEGETISYLDHFPPESIKNKNSSDMLLELKNGSIYCVMGIDGKNAQRARGMNPTHIILSEYAYMDPESWYTIEPRISQNGGSAIFLSTPNGKNHFYDLVCQAKNDSKNYFCSVLTLEDTNCLPVSHIEQLRKEGVPEDFIQQEYYCSFIRGSQGSYYGKIIQKIRDLDHVCDLPIIPDIPCHTSWDIGIGDSTAIWIFQSLKNGCYNFIDYYENHGEGLEHYIKYLNEYQKNKDIQWGRHFVPHDMQNREFTSGVDRISTAKDFGYSMTVIPKKPIDEGIQAVRSVLPLCFFHQKTCNYGLKCLDFYCKKYNESLKIYYDEPLHNKWSHGADAFRMAAIGIKSIGFDESGGIESDYEAVKKFWG